MSTIRRRLGTGPRPNSATAQASSERRLIAAERAAADPAAHEAEAPPTRPPGRRRLGPGTTPSEEV
ncbi:hypothetical protein [Streptomyces sp. NPDC059909]|uniref:hypothetical protein n=1 Tax=Streptomyces sp. NPDC059909 TaxID=3346998 RepID=UPI0036623D85